MTFGSSFWKKRVSVSTYFDVFLNLTFTMIAKVCDRESRQDTWFENRLVLVKRGGFVKIYSNSSYSTYLEGPEFEAKSLFKG